MLDFSRVAPFYRWLEYLVFGRILQQRRCAFVNDILEARNILVVGDGDGRFTAEFLSRRRTNSHIPFHIDFVDRSPGMIALARRRIGQLGFCAGVVQFHSRDIRDFPLQKPYDLVVSHFVLDCFSTEELKLLIPKICAATSLQARWVVSEFAIPEGRWLHLGSSVLVRMMYFFFQHIAGVDQYNLPAYAEVLASSGFRAERTQSAWRGVVVSELWRRAKPE